MGGISSINSTLFKCHFDIVLLIVSIIFGIIERILVLENIGFMRCRFLRHRGPVVAINPKPCKFSKNAAAHGSFGNNSLGLEKMYLMIEALDT